MKEWLIGALAFILGAATSAAVAGATLNVRMGAIEAQVAQQQKTTNILTVRSTRMEEQRSAQREAFERWANSVDKLTASNQELVVCMTKFDSRLGGIENEVAMLRRGSMMQR
jgi:uncharacterized membrane-anchored protein YhcB (DUF1043 family)